MKEFVLSEWRSKSKLYHHPDELQEFICKNKIIGSKIKNIFLPKYGLHDISKNNKYLLIDQPLTICTDTVNLEIDFSESANVFVNLNSIDYKNIEYNIKVYRILSNIFDETITEFEFTTQNYVEAKHTYTFSVESSLEESTNPFLKEIFIVLGNDIKIGFTNMFDYGEVWLEEFQN